MAAFEVATSADGSTWVGHDEVASGGVADVTFGSTSTADEYIKQTYDHLLLKASIRSEYVNSTADGVLQLNGVSTTSTYSDTNLFARTTAVESTSTSSGAGITSWRFPAAWNVAEGDNVFGNLNVWIPNYSNATNYKQVLLTSAFGPDDAQNYVWGTYVTAGLVQITGAITSITIAGSLGNDIAEFSTFTLYGITGA
jgi:hypothetical protein